MESPRKTDEDVGAATGPSCIVDDVNGETEDDDINQTEDSESDAEDCQFDTVCAICENGGELACCEGKCFRAFHTTPYSDEARESNCESLCLYSIEGEKRLICENCQYSLHQCYVCAELGSSDESSNPEVFRCSSAYCRHFYHPKCVASLLQKNDKPEQQTLIEKIAAGEPFICPAHTCAVCKETENDKVEDLEFAICRRCPKSYHRKCLPRDILFHYQIDEGVDAEIRAWDGLLPKSRALIYCLEHEIVPDLATPARTVIVRNILYRMAEQSSKKNLAAIKPEGSSGKGPADSSAPKALKKRKVTFASPGAEILPPIVHEIIELNQRVETMERELHMDLVRVTAIADERAALEERLNAVEMQIAIADERLDVTEERAAFVERRVAELIQILTSFFGGL